jgi:hypothetical protein
MDESAERRMCCSRQRTSSSSHPAAARYETFRIEAVRLRLSRPSSQPLAAVIKDLKTRGLFDETIVVCGSEFGRTPVVEVGGTATAPSGRDQTPSASASGSPAAASRVG